MVMHSPPFFIVKSTAKAVLNYLTTLSDFRKKIDATFFRK